MNWNSGSVFSVCAVLNIEFFSLEQLQRQGTELSTAQTNWSSSGLVSLDSVPGKHGCREKTPGSGVSLRTHISGCILCCPNTYFIIFVGSGFYRLLQRWNFVCEQLTLNWLAENLMWCQNVKLSYASPGSEECDYKAVVQRHSGGIFFFFLSSVLKKHLYFLWLT